MLLNGRVDLVVAGKVEGQTILQRLNASDDYKALSPPLESLLLYHYLNIKHSKLVPHLEQALKKLPLL